MPLRPRCARAARAGSARWCWPSRSSRSTPDADTARTLAQGIVGLGLDKLPWSKAALQFRTRVEFLRRAEGDEWPDLSDEGLARKAAEWLEPHLAGKTARSDIGADELSDAVTNLVPWNLRRRLDAEAPTHFTAPTGSAVPIDYEAEQGPTVSIRVQELFGLDQASLHRRRPRAAGDRAVVAGAPAGADDARSARLLARQLCRCEGRAARPLSAPSLAGRSDLRARRPAAPSRAGQYNSSGRLNRPLTIRRTPLGRR